MTELAVSQITVAPTLLLPDQAGENTRYRIEPYLDWLADQTNGPFDWLIPDLQAYGHHLQGRMGNKSVNAHLSTIRVQYRRLMRDNALRSQLVHQFGVDLVNEVMVRLENALHPDATHFPVVTDQDSDRRVRLSSDQVNELLDQIDTGDLTGMRDEAMIRLLLATGLREAECVALTVPDLYDDYEGIQAVFVARGKGNKSRKVPIAGLYKFFMPAVERWLYHAGINAGAVFRGVKKNGKPKSRALNKRSVEWILGKYPILLRGSPYVVKPHDLRATYARTAILSGVRLEALAQNMGHAEIRTTLGYVGDLSAASRDFDFTY